MLNMTSIAKIYRRNEVATYALRDISLAVDEGGGGRPSGSGKTTFLNVAGQQRLTSLLEA